MKSMHICSNSHSLVPGCRFCRFYARSSMEDDNSKEMLAVESLMQLFGGGEQGQEREGGPTAPVRQSENGARKGTKKPAASKRMHHLHC